MTYKDKRVLVRVEYNVPLDKKGNITDNGRILASIPTLKAILKEKPKQLILVTHLGRPKEGQDNSFLKTDVLAKELEQILKRNVLKVDNHGEKELPSSKIVFLENLRFDPREKKGNAAFAKQLASLCDIYVNESFGTSHRKDASMYVVPKYVKKVIPGILLKDEVKKLKEVTSSKELTVIVGFAKVSDKIGVLKTLLKKAHKVFVGGKVLFAFLKAQDLDIGAVEVANEDVLIAKKLLKAYKKKILLPVDVTGPLQGKKRTFLIDEIPNGFQGFDVGPKTIQLWKKELLKSKVVFWNGPLGFFEKPPFNIGTNEIAQFLAISSTSIKTIIGGGDTALAIKQSGFAKSFYHISTGGGASLEFIEKNGKLPALKSFRL